METSFVILVILQIILIFVLAVLLYTLLRTTFSNSLENRLKDYSLASFIEEDIPFFERVINNIWKYIRTLNRFIEKSEVLKKYSKKFNTNIINTTSFI